MPTLLKNKEIAHPDLTDLIEVPDMHTRKKLMMEMADAFIALPGGPGTMEEIFETITWSQIGLHSKPYAFYNVANYYKPIKDLLDTMLKEGFLSKNNYDNILVSNSLEEIRAHFLNYQPPCIKHYETSQK